MEIYKVQILLVSDQPSPNICPLTDPRTKPDEIILATAKGATFKEYQGWLIQVCKSMGIRCTSIELPDIWEISLLRKTFEELVEERLAQGHSLSLNSTCGHKPASIIAHEVFFYRNLPVFYVHEDWVRWLSTPNGEEDFNLVDKIRLPAFLLSHGLKVEALKHDPIPLARRELCQSWLEQANLSPEAIIKLNGYAYDASDTLTCKLDKEDLIGYSPVGRLIDQLIAAELATLSGHQLTFASEEARFFTNGGWLEEQVYSELLNLRSELPKLQDVARSVEICWLESDKMFPVYNELDVLALYDNRLIVIECKTARMDTGAPQKVIYKLGALLKNIGGNQATGLITSFHRIKPKYHERSELFDVQICDSETLHQLRSKLIKRLKTRTYT